MQRRRRKKTAPKNIFGSSSPSHTKRPAPPRNRPRLLPRPKSGIVRRQRDQPQPRSQERVEKAVISEARVQEIKIRGVRRWCIDRIKPWIGSQSESGSLKKWLSIESIHGRR